MLFPAKNGQIGAADYVRFGSGEQVLVMLPGLGDGLQTVKGTALPMALMYRRLAKDFTVYMFSRKNDLPQGHTTRDMAHDLAEAMDALGIRKASLLGVSMGGMIAQHLAIDHPEKVEKLILVVTAPRPNTLLTGSVEEWLAQAKRGDHTALMESNVRKIYSEYYYRANKWLIPITGKLTKPKSYHRFFVQAQACLTHDAYDSLHQIRTPTLAVGGGQDKALGGEASAELAAAIPGARLQIYPQWGHGLYEEEKAFNRLVMAFLN